jgi:glutamate formiminotransferase
VVLAAIPNVSEGRDAARIAALAQAAQHGGAALIDVHSDVDHHRSVFTLLGEPDAVERAVIALAHVAVAQIDLRVHRGVHPRVGAIDVVPLVPLGGLPMREAVRSAHRVGNAIAAELSVPVFFYGDAAMRADRRELPGVRRGGFETLAARMREAGGHADAGPAAPHPAAGAAVVGARGPLIAFNALLDSADTGVARAIARECRAVGHGLRAVRALGVFLESRQLAQVAMNLLDYRLTPPRAVAEWLERDAGRHGVGVKAYELVGCAPADVFQDWPAALAPVAGLSERQLLDPALFAAAPSP